RAFPARRRTADARRPAARRTRPAGWRAATPRTRCPTGRCPPPISRDTVPSRGPPSAWPRGQSHGRKAGPHREARGIPVTRLSEGAGGSRHVPRWSMLSCMNTAEYGPCDVAYHIARLRAEGELLASAAERAGLDAPVPACPGWRVRDLLKHLGYVHRWAAGYVREQHARWVDRASEAEILRGGPEDEALAGWFRDGHAALVRALAAAAPGM